MQMYENLLKIHANYLQLDDLIVLNRCKELGAKAPIVSWFVMRGGYYLIRLEGENVIINS